MEFSVATILLPGGFGQRQMFKVRSGEVVDATRSVVAPETDERNLLRPFSILIRALTLPLSNALWSGWPTAAVNPVRRGRLLERMFHRSARLL